ncbi:MAG TPA: hypothetical protein VGJ25_09145 [Gaiellaceae bacterium]
MSGIARTAAKVGLLAGISLLAGAAGGAAAVAGIANAAAQAERRAVQSLARALAGVGKLEGEP